MLGVILLVTLIGVLILLGLIWRYLPKKELKAILLAISVALGAAAGSVILQPINFPPTGAKSDETIRPNAVGTYTQWDNQYPATGSHWQKVDEETSDGDSTYVYTQSGTVGGDVPPSYRYDTYNLQDSSIESGTTIYNVTVHVRVRSTSSSYKGNVRTVIRTHSSNYVGTLQTPSTSYTLYSKTYNDNPNTGSDWTLDELNALQVGAYGRSGSKYFLGETTYYPIRMTQAYAIVEYEEATPTFSDAGHNQTQAREVCKFYINITAPSGQNLSHWTFSTNVSGVWRTDSHTSFPTGTTSAWANVTKVLHYNSGSRVEYKWWANATNGLGCWSSTYSFDTTEEQTFYVLKVDGFTADYDQWTKNGTSPYLHDYGQSNISVSANSLQSGWFTFEDLPDSCDSIIGTTVELRLYIKCEESITAFRVYYPNATGTIVYQDVAGTSDAWLNRTYTLSSDWWTPYRLGDFKIKFHSLATQPASRTRIVDYAELRVSNVWSRKHMLSWLWNETVKRQINSSFPLVKGWNAHSNSYTPATPELLWGANLYKLMGNNTSFLEKAYEYADWLQDEPICRLWQRYNKTSEVWVDEQISDGVYTHLFALSILANVNSSYNTLLESAAQNFTDIFYDSTTRLSRPAKVDGSNAGSWTTSSTHAGCASAVFYANVILNNVTWRNWALESWFKFNITSLYIWYNSVNASDNTPYEVPAKEDMSVGIPILSGQFMYIYSGNTTLKNRIENMTEAAIKYFWNPDSGDNGRFIYQVHPETGAYFSNYTVHGFGLLEEAIIQSYLLFDQNSTWLERVRRDWISLVHDGAILKNDLICHAVQKDDTIPSTHFDSNDYWNAAAKRVSQVLYNLNVTGFYHNSTFLEGYEKLYGATSVQHKSLSDGKGWVRVINANTLSLWTEATANMILYSIIFRNFQAKNTTINTFDDLYINFGNPFTGEEGTYGLPTYLGEGWNEFTVWSDDVGHTLAEVNASVWNDGIQLQAIVYINATAHYEFYYQYHFYENATIAAAGDTLRLFCNSAGTWYHGYG